MKVTAKQLNRDFCHAITDVHTTTMLGLSITAQNNLNIIKKDIIPPPLRNHQNNTMQINKCIHDIC